MKLLLEVDGGYVEVADDGRLRAAVRECRDAPTKRNGTIIEQLGSDAIAAAADAACERYMGVAGSGTQAVEPRPEPAGAPRVVFAEEAARDTFLNFLGNLGDGWAVDVLDDAGVVHAMALTHTTGDALVGWRWDGEEVQVGDQVRVPVERVVEVKVW